MVRTRALVAAILVVTIARSSSAQGSGSSAPTGAMPGGGTRVMNRGPGAWPAGAGWTLRLERTIQPAEGNPGALQNPCDAMLASDGRVVTVDLEHPAIREYDKTGRFVRMLGRVGDGPGEYRQPFTAIYRDTLLIHDPTHHRLSTMTLDGRLIREVAVPANDWFPIYVDRGGRIAMRQSTRDAHTVHAEWVYYTRDGTPRDSIVAPQRFLGKGWDFASPEGPDEVLIPFGPESVIDLLDDGTAVEGRTDRDEFVITRTGRDTLRVFGRIDPPLVTIPATIRDSAFHAAVDRVTAVRSTAKESDVPRTYLVWHTLQHDDRGNIWVGAMADRPGASRFDVFTRQGRLLGSIAAPFGVKAPIRITGDRILVIDADADDLPRIRIFHIDRGAT